MQFFWMDFLFHVPGGSVWSWSICKSFQNFSVASLSLSLSLLTLRLSLRKQINGEDQEKTDGRETAGDDDDGQMDGMDAAGRHRRRHLVVVAFFSRFFGFIRSPLSVVVVFILILPPPSLHLSSNVETCPSTTRFSLFFLQRGLFLFSSMRCSGPER